MDLLKSVSAAGGEEAAPKMEDGEEGLMWRPSKGDTEGHQLEIIRRHCTQCLLIKTDLATDYEEFLLNSNFCS